MTVLRVLLLRRLLRWGLGIVGRFGVCLMSRLYVECEYLKINVGMQLDICKVKEGVWLYGGVSPSALEQPLEERGEGGGDNTQ